MPEKLTREDLKKIFEEKIERMRKEPQKPKARIDPDPIFDEIARIMGWENEQPADGDVPTSDTDVNEPEIDLALQTDIIEGDRRDEWFANPPENCDFCRIELLRRRYFVDGKLKESIGWANMCAECFFANGEGIGWGLGQAYLQKRPNEWLLVGGFPPDDGD